MSDLPKLVRDRIPELIVENDDGEPEARELDDGEILQWLRKKLVEEAREFEENGKLEEIADIIEVMERLEELVDWDRVKELKQEKREERGGFDDNIVLEDL